MSKREGYVYTYSWLLNSKCRKKLRSQACLNRSKATFTSRKVPVVSVQGQAGTALRFRPASPRPERRPGAVLRDGPDPSGLWSLRRRAEGRGPFLKGVLSPATMEWCISRGPGAPKPGLGVRRSSLKQHNQRSGPYGNGALQTASLNQDALQVKNIF